MKAIVFIGIQGCGKGTQAKLLSEFSGYQHINIGDLLRRQVAAASELGMKVQSIISRGELVPDEVVFEIVSGSLEPGARGIIFDGFPRTREQAEYLIEHYDVIRVYNLELSKQEAISRISARRICQSCGHNFNIISLKPKISGICDACGGELITRPDDTPASIENRINEFYEQTYNLIQFFETKQLLKNVSADQTIEEIFAQLKADYSSM
ncbi:MAG: nucleoside monophosphate kinase [Candidatus Cloacimonetes bacterium]|nr:nucleoside monophosphate kinase [Candidatus Cloacimonadota bacterium]